MSILLNVCLSDAIAHFAKSTVSKSVAFISSKGHQLSEMLIPQGLSRRRLSRRLYNKEALGVENAPATLPSPVAFQSYRLRKMTPAKIGAYPAQDRFISRQKAARHFREGLKLAWDNKLVFLPTGPLLRSYLQICQAV